MRKALFCVMALCLVGSVAMAAPIGTSWSSYNLSIRDDGTNPNTPDASGDVKGCILGSDGSTTAMVRLYQTDGGYIGNANFDVDVSDGALSNYFATPPSTNEPFSGLGGPGWYSSTRLGFRYYVAKSDIARGTDTRGGDETDGPLPPTLPGAPNEIYDFQYHPENGRDNPVVLGFQIPEAGSYEVLNFAARRWSDNGDNSAVRIFGPDGEWLGDPSSNFFAGVDMGELLLANTDGSDWQIDPASYVLPNLAAGDTIYFVLHRDTFDSDGQWSYDGTELTFDVVKVPEPGVMMLLATGLTAVYGLRRRRA